VKHHIFEVVCQGILIKKWGILIKTEMESLDFIGLKIPNGYKIKKGGI